MATLSVLLGLAAGAGPISSGARAAARAEVTILAGPPSTLDPALQGDVGSAGFSAQLFESLTAFDLDLALRPALARSWDVSPDGRRIVFHLRPGLTFSDGSRLTADDVVGSWLRIVDPRRPSPLASLLLDVHGVADRLGGRSVDPLDVGLRADGLDVDVELDRPGADFPAIVSSAIFGIVPRQVWGGNADIDAGAVASSGAYAIKLVTDTEFTLAANERYWAGTPAIATVHLRSDIGGRSPVAAFQDGDVDYAPISSSDASWIRYDDVLGPDLRLVPSLSLTYVGFTSRPPFDDVRVRQAFARVVDWRRVTVLGSPGDTVPADSTVPPGVPGGGDQDWLPKLDPVGARRLLAEAGFPGGAGFPIVTFAAGGIGPAEGIAEDLRRELGVAVHLEELDDHVGRLVDDPPAMWSMAWVADYPGANDFLGVLLGTDSSNNYGRWSSPGFDAAINDALATRDPGAALAAYERALAIVRDEAPVVPIAYGDGWALSRGGLLGAGSNGLGVLRLAGLAWE